MLLPLWDLYLCDSSSLGFCKELQMLEIILDWFENKRGRKNGHMLNLLLN